jgi:hypothetical protein
LFAVYNCYSYCVQLCLIYDPDSSPSLSYIWSWFFNVTVIYMILILPRHCLIYDPDFPPSLSYIWSWFFPVMHCLVYDPDSSPSCTVLYMVLILSRRAVSYIWSWFFPVSTLFTRRTKLYLFNLTLFSKFRRSEVYVFVKFL